MRQAETYRCGDGASGHNRGHPAGEQGEHPLITARRPADRGERDRLLMNAGWFVPQLGDVLVPLPGREACGCGANPPDGDVGRLRVEPAHAARGPVARAHVYQAQHAANRAYAARQARRAGSGVLRECLFLL